MHPLPLTQTQMENCLLLVQAKTMNRFAVDVGQCTWPEPRACAKAVKMDSLAIGVTKLLRCALARHLTRSATAAEHLWSAERLAFVISALVVTTAISAKILHVTAKHEETIVTTAVLLSKLALRVCALDATLDTKVFGANAVLVMERRRSRCARDVARQL